MKQYLLALDQGTSGMKLMVTHVDGQKQFSVTQPYPTHTPHAGYREQNPQDWWQAVCDGVPKLLKKAGISAADIAAIGVDGISWTPVMLDAQGEVLGVSPIWNDTRSVQECREICETVGEERVFEVSGNPVQPYYMTSKLLWYRRHEPERIRKTAHVLTSNGFLVYRLTGCMTQDLAQAYGWAFHNTSTGAWDGQMAEQLGIDLDWLPSCCESTHVAGAVTAEASRLTGLQEGTPVVAGGLDAACGALGAGVFDPGPTHEQSGSAGGMSICTDRYQAARGLILSRHVVPGRWLLQGGTVGGGGAFQWMAENLNPSGAEISFDELNQAAQAVSPGADGLIFLPYLAGERSPIWNPDAKGVFYGLDFSKGRGHLVRAVMEGTAYALRHNLEAARQAGVCPSEMRAVGGGSASPLWMQIKADIAGYPIRAVARRDATCIGCSMMAGVGAGIWKDFAQASERFVELGPVYQPDEKRAQRYQQGFEQYCELYSRLESMMK